MSTSFVDHFAALEDPRIDRNKRHQLIVILVLVVTAVSAGANGWGIAVTLYHLR